MVGAESRSPLCFGQAERTGTFGSTCGRQRSASRRTSIRYTDCLQQLAKVHIVAQLVDAWIDAKPDDGRIALGDRFAEQRHRLRAIAKRERDIRQVADADPDRGSGRFALQGGECRRGLPFSAGQCQQSDLLNPERDTAAARQLQRVPGFGQRALEIPSLFGETTAKERQSRLVRLELRGFLQGLLCGREVALVVRKQRVASYRR